MVSRTVYHPPVFSKRCTVPSASVHRSNNVVPFTVDISPRDIFRRSHVGLPSSETTLVTLKRPPLQTYFSFSSGPLPHTPFAVSGTFSDRTKPPQHSVRNTNLSDLCSNVPSQVLETTDDSSHPKQDHYYPSVTSKNSSLFGSAESNWRL